MHSSHGPHSWIQVFPPLVLALDAGELPNKFSVTSASTQKIAEVVKNLACLWWCLCRIGSHLAAGVVPMDQIMGFFDMLLVSCMTLYKIDLCSIINMVKYIFIFVSTNYLINSLNVQNKNSLN